MFALIQIVMLFAALYAD